MPKKKSATSKRKDPWKKRAPKGSHHTKLKPETKARAKAAAKRAGRKYPNLVDNMNAAKKQRRGKARSKSKD
jgi:ribosomal protein L15E